MRKFFALSIFFLSSVLYEFQTYPYELKDMYICIYIYIYIYMKIHYPINFQKHVFEIIIRTYFLNEIFELFSIFVDTNFKQN